MWQEINATPQTWYYLSFEVLLWLSLVILCTERHQLCYVPLISNCEIWMVFMIIDNQSLFPDNIIIGGCELRWEECTHPSGFKELNLESKGKHSKHIIKNIIILLGKKCKLLKWYAICLPIFKLWIDEKTFTVCVQVVQGAGPRITLRVVTYWAPPLPAIMVTFQSVYPWKQLYTSLCFWFTKCPPNVNFLCHWKRFLTYTLKKKPLFWELYYLQ